MHYPTRGTYGFRIVIKGVTSSTKASAQTEIVKEEYFTNYDMYGNTYAYYTPYTQQKVIDISDFINVHSIDIYFYQDFNFADYANKFIYYYELDGTANEKGEPIIPENIKFDNVNIYLGVSAEDIKDETTFLYSYDALSYLGEKKEVYDDSTGALLKIPTYVCNTESDLHYVWVHYEKNGTFSVIDEYEDLIKQRGEDGLKETHVFWYRYLYDEDITEDELKWKEEHAELEKDWNDSMINESYECKMERYAGANWTFIPAWTDSFNNTFIPRGNKSREKFKVVVHHDGTHTTSKELIFTNLIDIEAEIAAGARNDAIVLKTFKLQKVRDAKNEWINGQYEAVEDGSINAFHVYDENNKILYNDDNERFDEHHYYMQIQVKNEDTYKYEMLTTIAENGSETNTQVAWAFPYSYTMIRSTEEVNENDAAWFGIDATNEPIRYANFHNSTMKFTIQPAYNNRYLDNTVGAIVTRNGENHHIEKALMFGRAEGLGHEFLPVLKILYPADETYIRTDTEFQIACAVYNKDGSEFENPSLLTFNWREVGEQSEFYHYDKNENRVEGYQITSAPDAFKEEYKGYSGNVIRGWLKGNNAPPPIFEVTVNGAASYPLTIRRGFLVCNNHEYKHQTDVMSPSRVEFKSDGAAPIFYNDYFEVLYYDNNTSKYQISYPEWKINNTNTFHLEERKVERSMIEQLADGTVGLNDRSYYQYKLAFNTEGNPQWEDNYLKPEKYTYIYYNINDIYVAQAIAFDRNYYASSLVNNWDGTSLTWDEENGAILSTMIAAGSKDGENKFTGVMMGDWHAKGDESLDTPGMYGYNKGEQTFGFKTDGTGFIGASGKGRIEFDGTEALISNADRTCYINLNPVLLDLENWNVNNQSFSQNFIYCKVPKTTNNFSDIYNSILGKQSWARTYFEDTANDYFVVDPNYGVLTTGGIVARYGALGNWMISNEGLYQKDAGKYMYIGYDSTDTETGENQRYCIYAGTDFGDLGNLESAPGINPYFYVTWDGTLFARKGLIANTWTIDDTSLQYIKSSEKLTNGEIFDKIYIGQGDKNTGIIYPVAESLIYPQQNIQYKDNNGIKYRYGIIHIKDDEYDLYKVYSTYIENGKVYGKDINGLDITYSDGTKIEFSNLNIPEDAIIIDAKRWAISAGEFTDYTDSSRKEDTDYINFGVTLNGELYSQLGTIGGWKINQNQLYSSNGKMIFNSEQSVICVGDATYLGKDSNGKDQYAYSIMIDGKNGLMSIAGTNHKDLTTGFLYLGNFSIEAISINSSWQVPYSISQNNIGEEIKLSLEIKDDYDNANDWSGGGDFTVSGSVAPLNYYRQNTTTSLSTLTSSNTFNIVTRDNSGPYGVAIATGITENGQKIAAIYPTGCTENYPSLGIITPSVNGSTISYRWNVYANILDAVSINTAGAISANVMYMSQERVATEPWVYNLLTDVWNALNSLSDGVGSNAGSIGGLGSALANAVPTQMSGRKTGDGEYTIDYKNKNGGVVFSVPMTDINHGHQLKLSGTSLSMEARARDGNDGIELAHYHGISGSMSSNGVLTIEWKSTNFNSATSTSTIDCSSWLIEKVRSIWQNNVYVTCTAEDDSKNGEAKAEAQLKWSTLTLTKTDDASWRCTASHGANIVNTGEDVQLNGTYTRYIIDGRAYYR